MLKARYGFSNLPPDAPRQDLGVHLFKIQILEQMGNLQGIEPLLRKMIDLDPQELAFRKQLVKYYLSQKRMDDAETELRTIVAASPTDMEAGRDLIRSMRETKGPAAARQEVVTRINAGGQVFPYQIMLAEFDLVQGNVTDGIKLLEKLAESADFS